MRSTEIMLDSLADLRRRRFDAALRLSSQYY
jgi:hypothetical protein